MPRHSWQRPVWRTLLGALLTLIKALGMREFPPRLPDQPIFYPVLTEASAVQIARDWNVQASGSGFVTRFEVLKSFLDGYRVEHAGSRAHLEYWIPAEDLPQFNKAIVGEIVVTAAFGKITESTT